MSAVFQVERYYVKKLLDCARKHLETYWSTPYYNAAVKELHEVNPNSMQFTEKIAAIVHDIVYTVLTRLFGVRLVSLDQVSLLAAIQAQLSLAILLSELKPLVQAYLDIVDPEKLDRPSEKDSSCAIEEEELIGSEEDDEEDEIEVMKDNGKPWAEICFYLLERIAIIPSCILQIASPSNVHPALSQLLRSSSVTAIEPRHHDMDMEHWEDTVDYLLKDTHNVERGILKDNLRKIACKTASLVFSNDKKGDSTSPKSTNTLKFTGAYHCELALMALLLRVCINNLLCSTFYGLQG